MRFPAITFCALIACGGQSKLQPLEAPQSPTDNVIEEAAQIFFESGQVIIDAGGDCEKMATSVGTWIYDTRARRHKLNELLQGLDSEVSAQRYRELLVERLDLVVGMMAGLDRCISDEDFRTVWERLEA